MGLAMDRDRINQIRSMTDIPWKVKYLGITIEIPLIQENVCDINLMPTVKYIEELLFKWRTLNLSLVGRISALKMKILPKLLFIFRSLILHIPKGVLFQIQKIFNTFVWMDRKPRIRATLLQQKQTKGGLALPNVAHYYQAAMLDHASQWMNASSRRMWELEQRGIAVPLSEWMLGTSQTVNTSHTMTKILVSFWKKHREKVILGLSPLASFCGIPFQEAVKLGNFSNWSAAAVTQFFKLGKGREMHSLQALVHQIGDSP